MALVSAGSLTGWCQINGRNALSSEQKFSFDVWYLDHRSLWLDVKILVLTLGQVLARRGISASDHTMMLEFRPPVPIGKVKVNVAEGSEAEEGRRDHGTTRPPD